MLDQESLFWTRSWHVTGTSITYLLLYLHLYKVIWTQIGPCLHPLVVVIGGILLLLTVGIAFLGYVLPLSQMSYWGLIVFSNIIGVVPVLGRSFLLWLWGGEFISGETMVKIHLLHVILPFVSIGCILLHLNLLHKNLSACGFFDRGTTWFESTLFSCVALYKDLTGLFISMYLISFGLYINWTFVFHEESFEMFNPEKTSSKIIPEWFFLVFFGFLKALPSKLGGLLCLVLNLVFISFFLLFMSYENISVNKTVSSNFSWIWLSLIFILSGLAAVVLLLFPMIELLSGCNLCFLVFVFFKIF